MNLEIVRLQRYQKVSEFDDGKYQLQSVRFVRRQIDFGLCQDSHHFR